MNDEEILRRPYKKLQATEELINNNALLDLYASLYRKKFKSAPIFPVNNSHITAIKDFAKLAGDRAYGLMEVFFDCKDDWFIKQAYSIDCLIKNINKVNAYYAQRIDFHRGNHKALSKVFCDHCWEDMEIVTTFNHNFDKTNCCDNCRANKTPPKRVTKQQIRQTLKIFEKSFPDVDLKDLA